MAQIMWFAGNFAPNNWAFCAGQLLSISENDALFAILGTTYGGDGQTTFALPDFRSRIPVGSGTSGLGSFVIGEQAGVESTTITTNQMPTHNHIVTQIKVPTSNANATLTNPLTNTFGTTQSVAYAEAANGSIDLSSVASNSSIAGGSQPFEHIMPYLAMNFVICLYGIFPSRS